jgi:glycosyltransferase involved in cell wall biosynthesis
MHVLIFCEQHPFTLGGAQVSVNLQAEFLERAGNTVTFVSPSLRSGPVDDERFIDLPSFAIPTVREYTWLWPRQSHLAQITEALRTRPPVDVVHVQSDFWGAALGYRFAEKSNLPLIHTMHHRLDVGVDGSIPFPGLFYAMLALWQKWSLGNRFATRPTNAFDYLGGYAHHADIVTAPSGHFARLLTNKGVTSRRNPQIEVVPTGVNDDVLDAVVRTPRVTHPTPVYAWVGRFSPEKRLLEFLDGVALAREPIAVVIVGDGVLAERAKTAAGDNVIFLGAAPYERAIEVIAEADFLVQSSHNFETQGMTVTEAVSMGTHVIIVDSEIAGDLPEGSYTLTADISAVEMGRALDSTARNRTPAGGVRNLNHLVEYRQSRRTEMMLGLYRRAMAR